MLSISLSLPSTHARTRTRAYARTRTRMQAHTRARVHMHTRARALERARTHKKNIHVCINEHMDTRNIITERVMKREMLKKKLPMKGTML